MQDTSAESILHSSSKNKVLTQLLATLTQFSAQLRCETGICRRNLGVQLVQAGLWVDLEFGQRYASEKQRTDFLIKLKELAILCVRNGDFMVFLTIIDNRNITPAETDELYELLKSNGQDSKAIWWPNNPTP